ncbi:protein YIPF1 isoform X2 [Dermacentor andersoni]|uniref:protein YIPF1 isoform X2 n=1 Tax=Dermacentor andersoni TaxID=34620 RepID=UPI002416A3C1|nr:protein YIPF1-like isoform X2 [Dermacentor andersoni]
MCRTKSTLFAVNILGDQSEAQANLQFQDFSDTLQGSSDQRSQQAVNQAYTSFSDMNDDEDESDEGLWKRDCPHRHWDGYHHILLQLLNRERDASAPSFWKFSYYQSLFDVTTNDVLRRLLWSAMPQFSSPSYLEKHIRPNPDLYGPIWVGLTLVVTTSVSSNVASYLETAGQSKDFWHTDYTRVSFASTAITVYMFLVPLVLWAVLKYRKVESRYSLLETLCLYGYSLAIYVPISILWAVHLTWLRWTLVVVGASLSGCVLVTTLWPSFREDSRKMAIITSAVVFALHALLALGFVRYFFQHEIVHNVPATPPPPLVVTTAGSHFSGDVTKVVVPVSNAH